MSSLRLSHCLYAHKTVLGKRGNALRFNKRLRMETTEGTCTLLIPIQARVVEYNRIVQNSNDVVHDASQDIVQ